MTQNGKIDVNRRVAIITGSTKGIGRAIANRLSEKGVYVVVTSREKDRAEKVADEIKAQGGNAIGTAFDLADLTTIDSLLEFVNIHCGRLDILVNNAITQHGLLPSGNIDESQLIQAITDNVGHTYLLCQKAFDSLKKYQGCILNVGSIIAERHLLGIPLYGLIKGAQMQMSKVLAAEWAHLGVRVNAVQPGFIRTTVFEDLGVPANVVDESYEYYSQLQPIGGVGRPVDVAFAVDFLVSEQASMVTGSVLNIDGGYSCKGDVPFA